MVFSVGFHDPRTRAMIVQVCGECTRLQNACQEATDELITAQRELAHYKSPSEADDALRLWKICEAALKTSWKLRDESRQHAASHMELSAFTGL
jgi:hypothetical protein